MHLVLNQGYGIVQAAKAMNVGQSSLQRWIMQYRQEIKGLTPQSHAISPEQQRIQALEAQIKQLKRDKYNITAMYEPS